MMKTMKKVVLASLFAAPFLVSSVNAETFNLEAPQGKPIGKIKLEKGKNFGYWKGDGSGASWNINVTQPGSGKLTALIGKPGSKPCGDLKAMIDGQEIAIIPITATGGWGKYKPYSFGNVKLTKGKHTITIVTAKARGGYFANMKGITIDSNDAKLNVLSAN